MEDLGEVIENFVETFSCTEEASTRLPDKTVPTTHGNLLVSSSLYGHLFAAVGSSIFVYNHASLRKGDTSPVAVVNLEAEHVTCIHALALGAHDTIIAHVTTTPQRPIVILNIPALAAGKIHALPGPTGNVTSFSISGTQSSGASQVLATLEEACVQLHVFAEGGTAPTAKISISNARCTALSPEGELLAVGTERGSVVIYNAKTGETCSTIVEVESGWVPFSTHFADSRSVLVSYYCETEVRHVVWHLSSDGDAITGHSSLGELCLAFLPFDDDELKEGPMYPMITCISLQDWNMCVVGSNISSDVEIIRKTDGGWEVWKFDEGKSPTLPTDANDDDTFCVGLAFDLNNTALIPGSDAASPKINPMPRVYVYTSDSLLLPFALIDSNPGVKCQAVRIAAELPPVPVNLRSIQSAYLPNDDSLSVPVNEPDAGTVTYSKDQFSPRERSDKPPLPAHSRLKLSGSSTANKEIDQEGFMQADVEDSDLPELSTRKFAVMNARGGMVAPPRSENELKRAFHWQQSFEGANSFLDNFSFSETSKEHAAPTTGTSLSVTRTMKPENGQYGRPGSTAVQEKPKVSLATSLDLAEAAANDGDIFGVLKSILTEMAEELRVSAEAEQLVSKEITTQKDDIVSSIAETREELSKLLQFVRTLFRNEATLRNKVSSTLSKVLSLSREYEKMSLEFHVKEADGFSRSLRAEEKEFDEKIASKEVELLRSIGSIEDRLNAEAEIQTRRSSPAELVQQVYSSLSLQGIRIRRVRSLLVALSQRMDIQDKGGRLSHLGLSLARLEKLNIHDEDVPEQSQSPNKSRRRESVGRETVGTPNSLSNVAGSHATSSQVDDTQLLPSDVRAVMRRLAMSGGRASISVTIPQSRTKRSRILTMDEESAVSDVLGNQAATIEGIKEADAAGPESYVAFQGLSASRKTGFVAARAENNVKTERASAPEVSPNTTASGKVDNSNTPFNSRTAQTKGRTTHLQSAIPPSGLSEVRSGNARLKTSALPAISQTFRPQSAGISNGVPSALLPPKKPLGQTLFPPSVQRNSRANSLQGLSAFGDIEKRQEQSPDLSTLSSAKTQGTASGKIGRANETKKESSQGPVPSKAFTFPTSVADVATTSSHGVFEIQKSSNLSDQGPSITTTTQQSVTPEAGVDRSTKSDPVQFATLPPDDDEGRQKTPIATSAPDFAQLPPDDDEGKQKLPIGASTPAPGKKVDTSKSASLPGFFAALPPDSDAEPILKESSFGKLERSLPAQAQESEKTATEPELFTARPLDLDTGHADEQSKEDAVDKERNVSLFDGSRLESIQTPSFPSTQKESLGTSDLFAALPPDDTVDEQVGSAVTAKKDNGRPVDQPPASIFADGVRGLSTESSQISQFASPFGAPAQAASVFGNASPFGASSTGLQSTAIVSAPERHSSRDGISSDESEEESTRFEGGMDTSSGGAGFFGASSSSQGSKQGFGFGAMPDSSSGGTAFGQSSASPFGSLSQSQPFGHPSLSQPPTQTGFESMGGAQGSIPSAFQTAQPSFGATSAFGASNASPAFGIESTFGAVSQLGAPSSFGTPSQLGIGSTPFASSNPTFGAGISAPKFGESSFGMTSSFGNMAEDSAASGFGNSSATSIASPFGSLEGGGGGGGGFGGASGGGSGFAALAGSQSGRLVFGNGGGPPSFTSAAFSQRRA